MTFINIIVANSSPHCCWFPQAPEAWDPPLLVRATPCPPIFTLEPACQLCSSAVGRGFLLREEGGGFPFCRGGV